MLELGLLAIINKMKRRMAKTDKIEFQNYSADSRGSKKYRPSCENHIHETTDSFQEHMWDT